MASLAKPQILLVLSDREATLWERTLNQHGYEAISVTSGDAALQRLEEGKIDLIMLDIARPDLDSFELCKSIKMNERFQKIPVIMLTGEMKKKDRIKSIRVGAEDLLLKDENEEIMERLKMLIAVKVRIDRLQESLRNIVLLSTFAGELLSRFDPWHFEFEENIDAIVQRLIRKNVDMLDQPSLVLVGIFESSVQWRWYQYEYLFHELIKIPLQQELDLIKPLPEDLPAKVVIFNEVDSPKPKIFYDLQSLKTVNIHVKNGVCYLSKEICLFALNYGRNVYPHDAAVLENMAVNARFLRSLACQIKETENAFAYTVHALARAAEANDEDTGNHIVRVGEFSAILAERLLLGRKFVEQIRLQAVLHDVGKVYIAPAILRKREKLSAEEWLEVRKHPVYGANIIGDHPRLRVGYNIALNHHERWDGTGYPRGLRGESIPIEARIVNLADQYDALRMARGHKPAYSHEEAYEVLTKGDGRTLPGHFDPQVLTAFREVAALFAETYEKWR